MILRKYKAPRHDPRRDPAYLAWIRTLPCVICFAWKLPSRRYDGKVEAAHVGERGLGQKCPDQEALPLCILHHRTGEHAHHVLGKKFWQFWKLSRHELVAEFQKQYAELVREELSKRRGAA